MNWYLIWKYKYWIVIFTLSLICFGLLTYTNHLAGEINKAEAKYQAYIDNQDKLMAIAQSDALAKEKELTEKLLKAEENYSEKIKIANDDANRTNASIDRLSKQLSEARRNSSTATKETIIKYVDTTSELFRDCVIEYRKMGSNAQSERIDKEKLIEAWPE